MVMSDKNTPAFDYATSTCELMRKYKNTENPVTKSVYLDIIKKRPKCECVIDEELYESFQ